MCNPCLFVNESSGTSDTGSTKNTNNTESEKIYELQESVLKLQPPDGAAGEVNKITSSNSPCDQILDCSNPGITLTLKT